MEALETKLEYLIELLEKERSGTRRFLTKEEAAEYMGMSSYTLDEYQRLGKLKIPSVKIGKLVRYDLKDIERYGDELPRRERKEAQP
ncbi:helix-turn-helix domain-containing protein [Cloacibacillus porcorum]|uniref:helix-turn-helix transcriptional regulator n=1 Tax=Cloacibacillus porcorum TaxID=1197717 RepID=UPI0023F0710A|nr:helix-turn-helix domain-containing protein [Cloacibacillus porcorum]MCC8184979.1 helix-turn-helix domain-containing protein [Cloacibacillus porcorum]